MNKIAEKNDALDAFIANYCIDHPLSGSVRITLNDKIIYQKFCGKADYENDRELDEKSVFSLYSLSKPFCAIGLMKLFDKGLVDIDTHPGEYLPEMCGFDKRVTVRQMLCHTSGLPDFVQTEGFTDKHPDGSYDKLKEALLQLSCYPMLFEPGTAERYENINFLPLALIIENVSGMSYSEYMEQEVFSPLGMSTAKVDFPGLIVSLRVKGYVRIEPYFPEKLMSAQATLDTVRGDISVHWVKRYGKLILQVSIPFGTETDVVFDGRSHTVKSGFHVFEKPL